MHYKHVAYNRKFITKLKTKLRFIVRCYFMTFRPRQQPQNGNVRDELIFSSRAENARFPFGVVGPFWAMQINSFDGMVMFFFSFFGAGNSNSFPVWRLEVYSGLINRPSWEKSWKMAGGWNRQTRMLNELKSDRSELSTNGFPFRLRRCPTPLFLQQRSPQF